ncbi:MAG TPA: hypothetical protein VLI94_10060 [Solirubrobacterales bacterium]|nr:hypothetical protein [Solirubrobacterales bacterium]
MKGKEQSKEGTKSTICSPLAHPLRVRILEVVNEYPISPVGFIDAGFAPAIDDKQKALSLVSYHFRALEQAGCIEIIATRQVRGATEHIYGGISRVYFSDEEFEKLPRKQRKQLSQTSFQGLVARTDTAIRTGTFDARTDRYLAWRAMEVDQRGWNEIHDRIDQCFKECEQIRKDAEDRLAVSGDEVIPMTAAVLGFESPPRPALWHDEDESRP